MMRKPLSTKRPQQQRIAAPTTLLAPVKGWNARDPLSAMAEGYAVYLDNWIPSPTGVSLRKGAANHATGNGTTVTKSLHTWNARSGTTRRRLFACTDAGIYDVTVAGTVWPAASIALTDGKTTAVNYGTTGGSYLFVVNGTDTMKQYDGTTWSSIASFGISGGGTLNTNNISNLNIFKRSLFFLKDQTLEFYYLPIDSIAGTVSRFNLAALFSEGGYLVAMGTWTIDGGQGIDDFAAFVTSEGQIAIYQGTDPSSASTWALQGVYDLAVPLGKKCFQKFGGDLLYLSKDGVFPISKALQSTTTNTTTAVSDIISNAFTLAAATWGANWGWQGIVNYQEGLALFNVPAAEFTTSYQYVMSTKTGAWCRFTDWNTSCFALMDNQLYMGIAGGVAKAYLGTSDFDGVINCYAKSAFSSLGNPAQLKQVQLLRPNLTITGSIGVSVAIDMDYSNNLDYGPVVFNPQTGSLWDSALWDTAIWSGVSSPKLDWVTTSTPDGNVAAVRLRVNAKDATVVWTATNLVFERGAIQG